jgi:cytochrome c oxidase cbb3-type subunit 3
MNKKSENISGWQKFMKSMTKANELGKEEDVMLDHDYDGIKELDNVLPPWWKAGFYITIAVALFYSIMVIGFHKYNQYDELKDELADAKKEVATYKLEHLELFSTANIKAFTDAANLKKGNKLFHSKGCVACHMADLGGGIGPNLTDNHWIFGGDVKTIFHTISKGGRPGKGMIAWEATISKLERQQLASYIISMQGTKPANPKAPQGDVVWPE